jgi:hypothetical protein
MSCREERAARQALRALFNSDQPGVLCTLMNMKKKNNAKYT